MVVGLPKPWNWRCMRLPRAGGTSGTWWILGVVPSAGRRALGQVRCSLTIQTTLIKTMLRDIGTESQLIQIRSRSSLLYSRGEGHRFKSPDLFGKCEWVCGWELPPPLPPPTPQQQLLLRFLQTRPSLEGCTCPPLWRARWNTSVVCQPSPQLWYRSWRDATTVQWAEKTQAVKGSDRLWPDVRMPALVCLRYYETRKVWSRAMGLKAHQIT